MINNDNQCDKLFKWYYKKYKYKYYVNVLIQTQSYIKSYILNENIKGDLNFRYDFSEIFLSFKEGVLLRVDIHNKLSD